MEMWRCMLVKYSHTIPPQHAKAPRCCKDQTCTIWLLLTYLLFPTICQPNTNSGWIYQTFNRRHSQHSLSLSLLNLSLLWTVKLTQQIRPCTQLTFTNATDQITLQEIYMHMQVKVMAVGAYHRCYWVVRPIYFQLCSSPYTNHKDGQYWKFPRSIIVWLKLTIILIIGMV